MSHEFSTLCCVREKQDGAIKGSVRTIDAKMVKGQSSLLTLKCDQNAERATRTCVAPSPRLSQPLLGS